MERGKERWVDIGKCMAIFAVMTDHVKGILYSSDGIQRISFYSVTLFILLMGVTTYWSFNNAKAALWNKVIKRIPGIFIPYVAAVFVYHWIFYGGFSWIEFKNYIIHFNISGPHYYVLLYMQLIAIAPVVFYMMKLTERLSKERALVIELLLGGGYCVPCAYG